MDYEKDVNIDLNNLDKEWLELPFLLAEYGERCASAKRKMLKAEEKVKTIRSEIILDVARNPDILGPNVKATAPNVEAYYRDHPDHQEAKEDLINATHNHEVIQSAVFALQAKKQGLENLVKLHGMDYFSEPHVRSDEVTEEARSRRKKKRVKRKRGSSDDS
jgi:hypothetical protein